MGTLLQDLRYGTRMLLKSPGFTIAAVLALALGIGANSAIFSVVNAVLLRPLPYEDPDRLVVMWETNPHLISPELRLHNEASPANFFDWKEQNHAFEQIAAFRWDTFTLTGGDNPEQLTGNPVTANMFSTLKVKPALGRDFLPEEDRPGNNHVVILSHGLWQRRFGSDPKLVGQTLTIEGESYTVVGIMPADFEFPIAACELWVPLALDAQTMKNRRMHYLYTRARLKPGVTLQEAQAEMDTIAGRLRQQYPDTNTDRGVRLVPLHEETVALARPALLILLGAVGFVLLIACANVANLMLARAAARQKEIAIRTALGAGRFRIVRQLLTESVLLSLLAGGCGLLLALWGVDLLRAGVPRDLASGVYGWNKIGLDARVLGFTLVVSVLTGMIFGLVPALQASKSDLNEALKEGGRTSAGSGRRRFRSALVISEVTLALVLLIGAGLMIRSFLRLIEVKPGFDPERLLTMQISLPGARYASNKQITAFYSELLQRLEGSPGIESAGTINYLPMSGSGGTTLFIVEGRPAPPPGQYPEANFRVASPGYFRTMKIPLLKGRDFTGRDVEGAPLVATINETMARIYFPNEDPTGKRLLDPQGRTPPVEIVGVVGDVKHWGLDDKAEEYVYLASTQVPQSTMALVVRTASDPAAATGTVRHEVLSVDKNQPVFDIKPMVQRIAERSAPRRLVMYLLGVFAGVALVLAAVGIYGVMAYSVTQRIHEIGLRMALGAGRRDILKLVVKQGMALVGIGLAFGLAASFAVTRVMTSLLFGIGAGDPTTFVGVSLLLAGVALMACLIPARRATRVEPVVALRYE